MKAVLNGAVLAESEDTKLIEGNHYFPPQSVDEAHLKPSAMRSLCPWKGIASYYAIEVGEELRRAGAWTYRHPFPWIRKIRGHVAFGAAVEVSS